MPRSKKPTPAQAQRIFNDRIRELLERYERSLRVAKGHPSLTTYWRRPYTIKRHRVGGHWVVRARAKKGGGK